MKLNGKKTKSMIFNFTRNHQFTTNLEIEGESIEIVNEAKLLGTIITDKLTWDRNTAEITKQAFGRMQLLNAAAAFTSSKFDLKCIYLTFVRSILEKSAVVWHSSLNNRNRKDLERVQKAAVRVIMGKSYTTYKNGLKELNIESLENRRKFLCLKFAKNCLKNEKLKDMFKYKNTKHLMKKRKEEKYEIKFAKTKRYKQSSLPYMTKLLNDENATNMKIIQNG